MRSSETDAVLEAADAWVTAQESLMAAREISIETESEEEFVDRAGVQLVKAVTEWRRSR